MDLLSLIYSKTSWWIEYFFNNIINYLYFIEVALQDREIFVIMNFINQSFKFFLLINMD